MDTVESVRGGLLNFQFEKKKEMDEKREAISRTIASNGPLGVQSAKKVIDATMDLNLEDSLDFSNSLRLPLNYTNDFKEALLAFQQKRKPVFQGS